MTQPESQRTTLRTGDMELNIVCRGRVHAEDEERAETALRRLAERAPRPVIFARAKLTEDPDRASDETTLAQGTLDMSGHLIRAQVAAPSMREAIDGMAERLERNLRRLVGRWEARRDRPDRTPEGQWRSGDLPTDRPTYYPRPPEERQVVRHKTYGPTTATPEEAAFDMEALDYRFFLFTLPEGEDAVVYETDNGNLGLRLVSGGAPPEEEQGILDVELNPAPAPELSVEDAKRRLDDSGAPFVFFRSDGDHRGRVLYRRYDGHYGLIEPWEVVSGDAAE